jgi:hypothetical protein
MMVIPISANECEPWLLQKHYAKRLCPISYAFGLYVDGQLVGVCTYGTPVSGNLRAGVCGKECEGFVLELNRLCCESGKNFASFLIGNSLNQLPKPSIVISYADTEQGHIGYVYQATNFIYTGLSAKRTNWAVEGFEHLHGATIADMSRGQENRADFMREKFGDKFTLKERSRKHRYIFFHGCKRDKKRFLDALRYKPEPFPKGDTRRYDAGGIVPTQSLLFGGC